MPKNIPTASPEILEAALQGLESQRQKLEEQIAQVRSLLGRRVGRPPRATSQSEPAHAANGDGRKRSLSEEPASALLPRRNAAGPPIANPKARAS